MLRLTADQYHVLILTASWILGFIPIYLRRPGWNWLCGVGLALVLSPFVRMTLDFGETVLDALQRYQTTGTLFQVLPPARVEVLWGSVAGRLIWYAVLPGLGLLLLHGMWSRDTREAAREIAEVHGLAPKRSWRVDALRGFALFFAIAVAYVAAFGVDQLIPKTLAGADESRYWRNITVPLIILLSASAGFTEEFLFRGVALSWLSGRMRWGYAAVAQALFFALIHAGYGSWTHVVAPFAFGLSMAWVARVLGVIPTALLHAQVNVLFFVFDVAPDYVAARGILGALTLAALVLAMAAASAWALRATRGDAVKLLWRSLRNRFAPVHETARS